MKKLMTMSAILMMAMSAMLTACSSSDADDNNNTQEEDAAEVTRIQEQMQADLIVLALCDYDEAAGKYTPRIGEAIQAGTPTIRYAVADTQEEARSRYSEIVSVARDNTDTSALPNDVTRGDVHVAFANGSGSETGRITVDCARLSGVLSAIVFVPRSAWPENDESSPFEFLSCWKEKSTGYYYICVREGMGGEGRLVTFDGGWYEDWFRQYDHWQGQFYLWGGTADATAFTGLADALTFDKTELGQLLAALSAKGGSGSQTYSVVSALLNGGTDTFDVSYTSGHHLWWAHPCYDVTVKRATMGKGSYPVFYTESYTHKQVPERTKPSHCIKFGMDYGRSAAQWEEVF